MAVSTPWDISTPVLAGMYISNAVKSNAKGSSTVSYSNPIKNGIPDLLIIANIIIPIAAIGVIMYDQSRAK